MQSFQRFLCATFAVSLLGVSAHANAAVFCVNTWSSVSVALSQSATNGQNNTIKIVAGTISPDSGFSSYTMTNAFNLDIEGGWSDDCSTQRKNAALTILDGTSADIAGGLSLSTSDSGNITVRYLTFQNYHGNYAALDMEASQNGTADLRVENCLFVNNAPASSADVMDVINDTTGSGAIYFLDNAVFGNVISGSGVVVRINGGSTAATCSICANNNTVSGNTLPHGSQGAVYITPQSANTRLANNIIWDNAGYDLDVVAFFSPILLDNDIGIAGFTPAAGSAGNISTDPQFIDSASGNYRLRAASPARDVGENSPPGTIRNYDLDGLARIEGAIVDMGAYEYHDVVFADGFESQ